MALATSFSNDEIQHIIHIPTGWRRNFKSVFERQPYTSLCEANQINGDEYSMPFPGDHQQRMYRLLNVCIALKPCAKWTHTLY